MNIAYYEKGNLTEKEYYGLGTIYNENGRLILKNYEQILALDESMKSAVIKRWDWRASGVFEDYGVGTLYKTNMRLVYIRTPRALHHLRDLEPIPDIGHMLWANNWKKSMFKECWEVPLEEIVGVWRKKNWKKAILYIFSKDSIAGTRRLSVFFFKNYHIEEFIGDLHQQRSVKGVKEVIKKYGKD